MPLSRAAKPARIGVDGYSASVGNPRVEDLALVFVTAAARVRWPAFLVNFVRMHDSSLLPAKVAPDLPMNDLPLSPSRDEFLALAARGDANLIPVFAELMADCETPVTAFQKLLDEDAERRGCALPARIRRKQRADRALFVPGQPAGGGVRKPRHAPSRSPNKTARGGSTRRTGDPFAELQAFLSRYRPAPGERRTALRRRGGGIPGLRRRAVVRAERCHRIGRDELGLPETVFLITDTMIVFDHRFRRLRVLANVFTEGRADLAAAYDEARAKIARLVRRLRAPSHLRPGLVYREMPARARARQQHHARGVRGDRRARQGTHPRGRHFPVRALATFPDGLRGRRAVALPGVAVHQPFAVHVPFPVRRAVRAGGQFAGGPRPRAGWHGGNPPHRRDASARGETPAEDRALAEGLLADPKERAEHLMLVDLARNDVGRIAEFGSVRVTDFMTVERYSHVMHIVSNVKGRLRAGQNAFDVMRATFPAGTVSGSPKVRAMQIINELEKSKRGCYAGAVGYFGFDGNLDSCITLRSVVLKDGQAYVQAGAGVVADSVAASEYEETVNKARGMIRAIELARHIGGEA